MALALALASAAISGCTRKGPEGDGAPKAQAAAEESSSSREKGTAEGKGTEGGGRGGKGGRGRGQRPPATVQVVDVRKRVLPRVTETIVALEGRRQVEVYSKVLGRVTARAAEEGTPVRAGQTLFSVDRSDPGESYLSVPVPSPISGWIGRWNVETGSQVTPQDAVLLVVDDTKLRAEVFLPVKDWAQAKLSTRVTFTVNGESREGRIQTIARAANAFSGRGSMSVEIPNDGRTWKSGMIAKARIELSPQERIVIPATALILTDEGAFVYTADGDKAKRVPVKYEVTAIDEVEILEGLAENDQLVVAGANTISNGAPVKVVKNRPGESDIGADVQPASAGDAAK